MSTSSALAALPVMAELRCPDCGITCFRTDGKWFCPECLCRVTQIRDLWVAVPGSEAEAARRHEKDVPCCDEQGHFWSLSSILFTQGGERLLVPIGHAKCVRCGSQMDAGDIYDAEEPEDTQEDDGSGSTGGGFPG